MKNLNVWIGPIWSAVLLLAVIGLFFVRPGREKSTVLDPELTTLSTLEQQLPDSEIKVEIQPAPEPTPEVVAEEEVQVEVDRIPQSAEDAIARGSPACRINPRHAQTLEDGSQILSAPPGARIDREYKYGGPQEDCWGFVRYWTIDGDQIVVNDGDLDDDGQVDSEDSKKASL